MPMNFCPNCGAPRLPDARFCGSCGADLAALDRTGAPAPPAATPAASPAWSPSLPAARTPRRPVAGRPAPLVMVGLVLVVLLAAGGSAVLLVRGGGAGSADLSSPLAGGFSPSPHVYQGVFVPTGSMSVARSDATATLLRNGQVLIAGGWNSTSELTSAELYDPRTGTFTPTGSMSTPRAGATATLLPGGDVLVAGGENGTIPDVVPLASAELYDPRTGVFTPTGSMSTPRFGATATLLPGGDVLIAGGWNDQGGGTDLASAELYDPRSGTFSPTGSMSTPRFGATATLLPDGNVLVAGGWNSTANGATSAELYDPRTGTFTPTGSMSTPGFGATATLLPDGNVLVAGGSNGAFVASAELYDPRAGTFTPTGSMSVPRADDTATLLPGGNVLVAGGDNSTSWLASAELYDPRTGVFTPTGSMSTPGFGATATLLPDGNVLVAGGSNGVLVRSHLEPLATAELFH